MSITYELNIGDLLMIVVTALAALGAVYIGFCQNKINKKLLALQDVVDVYLAIACEQRRILAGEIKDGKGKKEKVIGVPIVKIHNISTLPISLIGYNFNGMDRKISPYRLPPAAQFPAAYYYIELPYNNVVDYVSLLLVFEDSFKNKWKVKAFAEYRNGRWEISSQKPENDIS